MVLKVSDEFTVPCAEFIIVMSMASATKSHGGNAGLSIPSRHRGCCGFRPDVSDKHDTRFEPATATLDRASARKYSSSEAYLELMRFVGRFQFYSPFNAMLIVGDC